jgi:hypothetical protein
MSATLTCRYWMTVRAEPEREITRDEWLRHLEAAGQRPEITAAFSYKDIFCRSETVLPGKVRSG